MRWIWIDRFLEFHRGKKARAVKCLSVAEDYFADHFPGYPVMPACFILEGLAQTGGILVGEANDFQEKVVLAKIVLRLQELFLIEELMLLQWGEPRLDDHVVLEIEDPLKIFQRHVEQ